MAEYREILGFPDYVVSSVGVVMAKSLSGFRVLKQSTSSSGYKLVNLRQAKGVWQQFFIHVLVLEAFVSPRPFGLQTRHINGKKADNSLNNLRWGTAQENCEDRIIHGTQFTPGMGADHHCAVLTKKQARYIRRSRKRTNDLAKKFRVSADTIYRVRDGSIYSPGAKPINAN